MSHEPAEVSSRAALGCPISLTELSIGRDNGTMGRGSPGDPVDKLDMVHLNIGVAGPGRYQHPY